jgi:hypothetical protein
MFFHYIFNVTTNRITYKQRYQVFARDILVDHYRSTQHNGCTISRRSLTAETRFRRLLQIWSLET